MSAHGKGNPPLDLKNFAGPQPYHKYDTGGPLNKWNHSAGIHKDPGPSMLYKLSHVGRQALSFLNPLKVDKKAAIDEYEQWKNEYIKKKKEEKKKPDPEVIKAKIHDLRVKLGLNGGKNKSRKSRKSRKNRKTRSRKNRKTRSRK